MPLYDEKYMKTKVREFNGVIKTNFLGDEIPKENGHYTCMTYVTIEKQQERLQDKKCLRVSNALSNLQHSQQQGWVGSAGDLWCAMAPSNTGAAQ